VTSPIDGAGRRVLVTGGAGFIGATLLPTLTARGYDVSVLDNFVTGERAMLDDLGVAVAECDIRDLEAVTEAVAGFDAVVHLAAKASVVSSVDDPVGTAETNVAGTINVLEALRRANPGREAQARFVFASSNAPLGRQPPPATEEKVPLPISPYGAAKLAGEAYCLAYNGSYGLGTIALRFANVYGPHSGAKTSVVAKFLNDIWNDSAIVIEGDGKQTRDFVYVGDLADAIVSALASDVAGEVFQIGTGTEISIGGLAEKLRRIVDRPFEINYAPARVGDVLHNYSIIDKARRMLGWEPQTALDDGLRQTWAWFRQWKASGS
jgi:UDP-glucose 4-epimerase